MYDFCGFEESVEAVIKNVVELSKQLDLEVEADDVSCWHLMEKNYLLRTLFN